MKLRRLGPSLMVVSCSAPSTMDAGCDAGTDAGPDGGHDAGTDAGLDGGYDAGPCPHSMIGQPATTDDAGVRCVCEWDYFRMQPDGGPTPIECCDSDVGNPCPVCCGNP